MSDYDYVVVGSGAGGGPLAANLARQGFSVLLMEAGGDPCSESKAGEGLYQVPIFHGLSTESPECAWNYFVRHYTDETQQMRDSKLVKDKDGVWYPRASALGGCTTHHAMITVLPQASDWDYIAEITGDASWRADQMRAHWQTIERCLYVHKPGTFLGDVDDAVSTIGEILEGDFHGKIDHQGHGFDGWLPTTEADPKLVLRDKELIALLLDSVLHALREHVGNPLFRLKTRFDPNDTRNAEHSPEGVAFTPLAVEKGKRTGPREYVLRTIADGHPLELRKHALATRVLFEGKKAIGVEFTERPHAYRADPNFKDPSDGGPRQQIRARREVVISCGAFNTPQLLMLSGVGPKDVLARFGIPVIADSPGVGKNLQDRYEIGVISDFAADFQLLAGCTFAPTLEGAQPDAAMAEWTKSGTGVYASNGALIGIIKRSSSDLKDPDLYIFGLPGYFKGYEPGYSKRFEERHNRFTWAILKARTNNTGEVTLRSANPADMPAINFRYFGDGARTNDPDAEAVASGVEFVREMNRVLHAAGLIHDECVPGAGFTDEKLRQFIRDEAWGHHASCTAKIGADNDREAVLDSRFRVRGVEGLRVVDASVFPKIPGYFIVSAIYMIGQKATEAIVADANPVAVGTSHA